MHTITIFAGINGAGKSTLYNFYTCDGSINLGTRICPDDILKDNNWNWENKADTFKSGREALLMINQFIENKQSFNWEFTIINNYVLKSLFRAKELGFKINLNFIGVNNVELSLNRIKQRVLNGGHGVSEDIVRYRFTHQFDNFDSILPLLDSALFYDNVNTMQVVATYSNKTFTLLNPDIPWLQTFYHKYIDNTSEILEKAE